MYNVILAYPVGGLRVVQQPEFSKIKESDKAKPKKKGGRKKRKK